MTLAATLWDWSLDGMHDEEYGDVQVGSGWWALFVFNDDERQALGVDVAGALLNCDNDGFKTAHLCDTRDDLFHDWGLVVTEHEMEDMP